MKIFTLLLCSLFVLPLQAQNTEEELIVTTDQKTSRDSSGVIILRNKKDKPAESTVSELFILGKNSYKRGKRSPIMGQFAPFQGHWSGFSYGFVNFAHLPESLKALELNWSSSFAMQFNLCKYSINFSPRNNFGLVTGIGLEYQRLRFDNDNISLIKREGKLVVIHPQEFYDNMYDIKRSSLKILYLTVPLLMEVQFPASKRNRMYVSGGFMGGIRMHSKTKIVYDDENGDKHKKKNKGDFRMVPFKADVVGRIGYRNLSVWGSYTLTNLFRTSGGEPDLHTYTVGLGITI